MINFLGNKLNQNIFLSHPWITCHVTGSASPGGGFQCVYSAPPSHSLSPHQLWFKCPNFFIKGMAAQLLCIKIVSQLSYNFRHFPIWAALTSYLRTIWWQWAKKWEKKWKLTHKIGLQSLKFRHFPTSHISSDNNDKNVEKVKVDPKNTASDIFFFKSYIYI